AENRREIECGQHEVDRSPGPGRAAVEIRLELARDVDVARPRLESSDMGEDRIRKCNQGRPSGGSQRHAVRLWRRDDSGIETPAPLAPDLGCDLRAGRF